mmetsp:Transcript_26626/g.64679  ORF Transcript_26626/g.64679 Transcript_26626/m.64679 type:complete len:120 (+) Transcript_26626:63-422(+)
MEGTGEGAATGDDEVDAAMAEFEQDIEKLEEVETAAEQEEEDVQAVQDARERYEQEERRSRTRALRARLEARKTQKTGQPQVDSRLGDDERLEGDPSGRSDEDNLELQELATDWRKKGL